MHEQTPRTTRFAHWLLLMVINQPLSGQPRSNHLPAGQPRTAEHPVLLPGINHYQPYSYEEDGQPKGLYNDLAREVFCRAGVPLRIELIPFHSVLRKIRSGFSDVMLGALQPPERDKYAHSLSPPLSSISTHLFVHKDSKIKDASLAQLTGKTIAIKQSLIMAKRFEEAVEQGVFKRYEVEAERQLALMLLTRRIDGFIHTTSHSLFHIKPFGKEQEIELLGPPIVDRQPNFLAFSRVALNTLPDTLVPRIEKALKSVAEDGTLAALHTQYGLSYSSPSANP